MTVHNKRAIIKDINTSARKVLHLIDTPALYSNEGTPNKALKFMGVNIHD